MLLWDFEAASENAYYSDDVVAQHYVVELYIAMALHACRQLPEQMA